MSRLSIDSQPSSTRPGTLNSSAQVRWLKTIEVFNEQGEAQQLKLFPAHVEPPPDDPQVARVPVNKVRLERTRQFGSCEEAEVDTPQSAPLGLAVRSVG